MKEPTLAILGSNLCVRCQATNRRGTQCGKPAMQGKTKCRTHGGASTGPRTQAGKDAIRRAHLKHGRDTLAAKAERSAQSAKLQALEDIMHVIRITSAKRTRGRKALGYVPIKTFEEARRWIAGDLLQQMKAGR